MINWKCERCWNTGEVGFFRKKVCPECNGDPEAKFDREHPRPTTVPRGQSGVVREPTEIHVHIHHEKVL